MDGYRAVLGAYAQGTATGGPILGGIQAVIAGGFAALQIANIAKTKFEGGGGGAAAVSGAASGGGSQPAQFNVVGNSGINQLADTLGGSDNKVIKAYVVSGDVTTAQSLDRNKIDTATL